MKIAKNLVVILTGLLCLRTLIIGASEMMSFHSPGIIQPKVFSEYAVSLIYSSSTASFAGFMALTLIWVAVKPWSGSFLRISSYAVVSISFLSMSYFGAVRYFRFQELSDQISRGRDIPDDMFLILSGLSTASIIGAAVTLFLLMLLQSLPRSEPAARKEKHSTC